MTDAAQNTDPVATAVTRRLRELEGAGRTALIDPGAHQDTAVFFVPDEVLTNRPEAVVALLEKLTGDCNARAVTRGPVSRVLIPKGLSVCLPQLATDLDKRLGDDGYVSLNHILTLAQTPRIGPGDDPTPTDEPDPQGDKLGVGWQVAVVDTGMFEPPPDHLQQTAASAMSESDVYDGDGNGVIDFAGSGHGGFIAGIFKRMIPDLVVHVRDVATRDIGRGTFIIEEADIIEDVDKALVDDRIAVINLSLGTYADEGDVPALRDAMRRWIAKRPDVLFAGAAGNDSVKRPFYPAAFAGEREFRNAVMSVGALDTNPRRPNPDAARADFSNRGRWVKAKAPGVHLHSDYPIDVDFVYGADQTSNNQDRAHFKGLAEWSGTSFATPYAAAEVIRYAATCGFDTPRAAWEHLRGQAPKALFPLDVPCPGKEPQLY